MELDHTLCHGCFLSAVRLQMYKQFLQIGDKTKPLYQKQTLQVPRIAMGTTPDHQADEGN